MQMSYKEFISYAKQNYSRGGDCVVECWDEQGFNEFCKEFGPMTRKKAQAILDTYANSEGY